MRIDEHINKTVCTIYLVRHGETEWNVSGTVQGQSESILTLIGVQQAGEVAKRFMTIQFAAIYSSDLLRAHRTAEIIRHDRQLEIRTSKLLRERSYGRFEGESGSDYRRFVDSHLEKIQKLNQKEKWEYKLENDIESNHELISRFITYLREIALAHLGQTVLVVTHGGPMQLLLFHLGYLSDEEISTTFLDNGAHIQIESDGINFEVKNVFGLREKQTKE